MLDGLNMNIRQDEHGLDMVHIQEMKRQFAIGHPLCSSWESRAGAKLAVTRIPQAGKDETMAIELSIDRSGIDDGIRMGFMDSPDSFRRGQAADQTEPTGAPFPEKREDCCCGASRRKHGIQKKNAGIGGDGGDAVKIDRRLECFLFSKGADERNGGLREKCAERPEHPQAGSEDRHQRNRVGENRPLRLFQRGDDGYRLQRKIPGRLDRENEGGFFQEMNEETLIRGSIPKTSDPIEKNGMLNLVQARHGR